MPAFSLLHEKALGAVKAASLCPAMDLLAWSGSDSSLIVQRWMSWQRVLTQADPQRVPASALAWSPDGQLLAAQLDDGSLAILSVPQESVSLVGQTQQAGDDSVRMLLRAPLSWSCATAAATTASSGSGRALLQARPLDATLLAFLHQQWTARLPIPLPSLADAADVPFLGYDSEATSAAAEAAAATATSGSAFTKAPPTAVLAYVQQQVTATTASSSAGTTSGGADALQAAASSIASLSATFNSGQGGSRGAASAGQGSQGILGASLEPAAIAHAAVTPLQVLTRAARAPDGACVLQLLAYGTVPLLHVRLPPEQGTHVVAATLASDLSSLACVTLALSGDGGGSSGSSSSSSVRLQVYNTASVAAAAPHLLFLSHVFCHCDAALRSMVRSAALCAKEWSGAHKAMVDACQGLASAIERNADPMSLPQLRAAAAAHYAHYPVPLAAAELFRHLVVGASSAALSMWLEAGITAGGLVKLTRSVESALAAMESLCVTRMARAGEMLLAGLGALVASIDAHSSGSDSAGVGIAGVSRRAVEVLIDDVTHALALIQVVRTAAAHARATYGAVLAHLRILVDEWTAADGAGEEETKEGDSAAAAAARARRMRTHSALAQSDGVLLKAALLPKLDAAAAAAGKGRSATAAAGGRAAPKAKPKSDDPLGLGFSCGLDEDAHSDDSGTAEGADAAADGGDCSSSVACDVFLPHSVTRLLGASAWTTDWIAKPMAAYSSTHDSDSDTIGTVKRADLCGQLQAVCSKWEALCAAPAASLSSLVVPGRGLDLNLSAALTDACPALPHSTRDAAAASLALTIGRSLALWYDDKAGMLPSEEEEEVARAGAHLLALPLPAPLVAGLCGDAEAAVPAVLLGAADATRAAVSIVQLPPTLSPGPCAYYGPLPGVVAAAAAAAWHTRTSTALADPDAAQLCAPPAVRSDGDASLCMLAVASEEADGNDGRSIGSVGGTTTAQLVQCSYTDAGWAPVSGAMPAVSLLPWALQRVERTALDRVCSKQRALPSIHLPAATALPAPLALPEAAAAEPLLAPAAGSISIAAHCALDVCGARGVAVILAGGRHVSVLDMEEDEEDEEDEEEGDDEAATAEEEEGGGAEAADDDGDAEEGE